MTTRMLESFVTAIMAATILFTGSPARGQEPAPRRMQPPPTATCRILAEDGRAVIPFEMIGNHVLLPVEVGGTTLRLILDTGMPIDGVLLWGSDRVAAAGLEIIGKSMVMGPGGEGVESDLAMGVTVGLPGVECSGMMAIVMPEDADMSRHFESTDGVIGQSLFGHFVVAIDYDNSTVTLTEPDRFTYAGPGTTLPLRLERYPIATCEMAMAGETPVPVELVIDTGNQAALTLNTGDRTGLSLPEKVIPGHARGVNGEVERLLGRIGHVQLGSFQCDDVIASFRTPEHEPAPPWAKDGALGQGLLRRFNVIFDYHGLRLILEPNRNFADPFDLTMAGIEYIRDPAGALVLTHLIPRSPATEAGLEVGDRITAVNGRPAADLSLDEVNEILKQEGEEVAFRVRRGEESIEMRVKLRRLI